MAEIDERITMVWFDLETTGLDANEEVPLELGIKLTDKEGFVIDECAWLVHDQTQAFEQKIARAHSHHIVGPMHTKSGLWRDLFNRETGYFASISDTDKQVVEWLEFVGCPTGLPMCGNSIGSLDRPFVLVHFPQLNSYLGYRNLDMSTLKELCKMHNPVLFDNLRPIIGTKSDAKHRVLDDIDASITEYRAYLDNFLFTE